MARIPMGEFGQTRAPVQPTPTPSAAQLDGGLSETVQRVGNTAAAIGQNAMDQQAAEAARLKAQQDAEAKREAEKQANRAEQIKQLTAHANIQTGLADLYDEINAGVTGNTLTKDDARKQWGERSSKLVADQVGQLPGDLGPLVDAQMKGLSGQLSNRLEDTFRKRDQQDADAGLITYKEQMQRFAQTDMPTAVKQFEQAVTTAGPGAGWSPEKIAKEVQGFKEQVTFTKAYETVSLARNDRKALDVAEQTIQGMTDMDPQKRATLLDRVGAYKFSLDQKAELAAQRSQRQREASLKTAEAAFQTFQGIADKGLALDPTYVDTVIKQTAGTPFQAGVVALAKAGAENGGLAAQPLTAQRAELDKITAQIAKEGNSPALQKRRDQIEKVVNGSVADYDKDPYAAAAERGVINPVKPLTLDLKQLPAQLEERRQLASVVRAAAGKEVSLFKPEEAQQLGTLMQALPPRDRATTLAGLSKQMTPGQMRAFGKQLGAKDDTLAAAALLTANEAKTTNGRYVSEIVLAGSDAMKEDRVKFPSGQSKTSIRSEIDKLTRGAFASEDAQRAAGDAAMSVYAGLLAEGGSPDIKQAVNLATGGVMEINGAKIIKPYGWDDSRVTKALRSIDTKRVESIASGQPILVGGQQVTTDELAKHIPGATLGPAPGKGSYTLTIGGRLVTRADGRPLVVPLEGGN
jgi:hypothetical protein